MYAWHLGENKAQAVRVVLGSIAMLSIGSVLCVWCRVSVATATEIRLCHPASIKMLDKSTVRSIYTCLPPTHKIDFIFDVRV